MPFNGNFHTIRRMWVLGLLWVVAVVELGLTADRVHVVRKATGGESETYIALLLADSVLTVIWVPIGWGMLVHERFSSRIGVHHELMGASILWLLWLVGAAGTTNTIIPGQNYCPVGEQCKILVAILAFAWIAWSLLTIALILGMISQAAAGTFASTTYADKRPVRPVV